MKNQLYGATTELETALTLARRWFELNPWEVKYWQRVWASDPGDLRAGIPPNHFVIDHTPIFLSLEEQEYRNSRRFTNLKKGEWLFAQSSGEGELATTLQRVSTKNLDPGMYESQNKALITELRRRLMQRDGVLVSEVLAVINEERTLSLPVRHPELVASASNPIRAESKTTLLPIAPESRQPQPLSMQAESSSPNEQREQVEDTRRSSELPFD
jgi:hypothetical protein